jgi:hypothetical protein
MIDVTAALNEWIPQVQGQYINMDWNPTNKGFGAQCWDLGAHWSDFLGLPRINTGYAGRWVGWAGNMVDAYPQTPEIEAAYELVGPDDRGQPGDMAVWGDSYWYYPATHIAVLVKDSGGMLLCMSQNSTPSQPANPYPGLSSGPTTIQSLPRQGLIGFLRPRTGGLSAQGNITPVSEEDEFMANVTDEEWAVLKQQIAGLVDNGAKRHEQVTAGIAGIPAAVVHHKFVQVGTDGKPNGETSLASVVGAEEANVEITRSIIREAVTTAVSNIPGVSAEVVEKAVRDALSTYTLRLEKSA